jgi:signal peptidase I
MADRLPPPIPESVGATVLRRKKPSRLLITLIVVFVSSPMLVLMGLHMVGLLQAFKIPTRSMSPALEQGDHVYSEGVSYLIRKPRRGDLIAFWVDEVPKIREPLVYMKRVAGLPGERLRLSKGVLYVNDEPVALRNKAGEILFCYWPLNRVGVTP